MQRWEEGARGGFEGPWFRPWLRLNRATSIRWKLAADSPKIKLHFSTRADPFLLRRGRGRGRRRRTKTISLVEWKCILVRTSFVLKKKKKKGPSNGRDRMGIMCTVENCTRVFVFFFFIVIVRIFFSIEQEIRNFQGGSFLSGISLSLISLSLKKKKEGGKKFKIYLENYFFPVLFFLIVDDKKIYLSRII